MTAAGEPNRLATAAADPLTEEGAGFSLNQIFDLVEAAQQQAGSLLVIPPPRRSPLGEDDARTDPLQLSHSINTLANAAIDHLHAIAALIRRAQMLHTSAPFTLARSAIEASGTAFWMLEPPTSRAERVRRLLAYQEQDRADAGQAWKAGSSPAYDEAMDRYQRQAAKRIERVLTRNTIHNPSRRLQTVKVLQEADRALGGKANVEFNWRLAPGFAHGRQWPTLHALTRVAAPVTGAPGLTMLALTNDLSRVLSNVGTAWMLTDRVIRLYRERSAVPRKV